MARVPSINDSVREVIKSENITRELERLAKKNLAAQINTSAELANLTPALPSPVAPNIKGTLNLPKTVIPELEPQVFQRLLKERERDQQLATLINRPATPPVPTAIKLSDIAPANEGSPIGSTVSRPVVKNAEADPGL